MKTATQISAVLARPVESPVYPATYAQVQKLQALIEARKTEAQGCCSYCQGFWNLVEIPDHLTDTEAAKLIKIFGSKKTACDIAEMADTMVTRKLQSVNMGRYYKDTNAVYLLVFQTAVVWNCQR